MDGGVRVRLCLFDGVVGFWMFSCSRFSAFQFLFLRLEQPRVLFRIRVPAFCFHFRVRVSVSVFDFFFVPGSGFLLLLVVCGFAFLIVFAPVLCFVFFCTLLFRFVSVGFFLFFVCVSLCLASSLC